MLLCIVFFAVRACSPEPLFSNHPDNQVAKCSPQIPQYHIRLANVESCTAYSNAITSLIKYGVPVPSTLVEAQNAAMYRTGNSELNTYKWDYK